MEFPALYYRTYNDLTARVIYLDKVQPQGEKAQALAVDTDRGL